MQQGFLRAFVSVALVAISFAPATMAYSPYTPWTNEYGLQNLVLGSSTINDVQRALGKPPDEYIQSEQMFPVIQNAFYYDEKKSGAASVFVFQNGLLAGLFYKSPNSQLVDLSYFLQNNGDVGLNSGLNAGFQPYFFQPQFFAPPLW
jgi:hypothetical protein